MTATRAQSEPAGPRRGPDMAPQQAQPAEAADGGGNGARRSPGRRLYHVVSTLDLSRADVTRLIESAERLRGERRERLRRRLDGAIVASLFYEPSTRTRLSFEAAVTRLGGRTLGAENARENSSAKKGESLEDVFRVVGGYADAIVIRHHEADEISRALPMSPVPVINAGAGSGEHPTQALLDVYTVWRELGRVDGLSVCVIGDLKYGRTVHSLLRILAFFDDVRVTLVHPHSLGLPARLEQELSETGLSLARENDFRRALREADIIYQTRIQRERLQDPAEAREADAFAILPEHLADLRPHARILHPLPRVGEIHPAVDADARAAYFRQAENGLYMRMALLDDILGGVER